MIEYKYCQCDIVCVQLFNLHDIIQLPSCGFIYSTMSRSDFGIKI